MKQDGRAPQAFTTRKSRSMERHPTQAAEECEQEVERRLFEPEGGTIIAASAEL